MNLCEYRHIFGKEGEGAHSYRFLDFAIVDVLLTILGGAIISLLFKTNLLITIVFLFILGIILHYIFCVETTLNKMIASVIS